jgi:hypothetical protein
MHVALIDDTPTLLSLRDTAGRVLLGMALSFSCGGYSSFFLFMSYLYIFGTPFSLVKPRNQTVFDYAQGHLS